MKSNLSTSTGSIEPLSQSFASYGVDAGSGSEYVRLRGSGEDELESSNVVGVRKKGTGNWCNFSSKVVTVAVLSSFLMGYNIAMMNSCSSLIALTFEWCGNRWDSSCFESTRNQSAVNAIVFLGAVVGSWLCGVILPYGRRRAIQIACGLFFVGGCVGFFAFNLWSLLVARTVAGVGIGLVTVATPIYISEMTTRDDRGYYGTMHQLMLSTGILAAIAIGLPQTPNVENHRNYVLHDFDTHWWRIILGFNALPSALAMLCFVCCCKGETPHHLLAAGHDTHAIDTVMRIYGARAPHEVEDKMLDTMRAVTETSRMVQVRIVEAVTDPYYRKALWIGFALAALQQLSGINVIVSSSDDLFAQSGMTASVVTLVSTGMAFVNVLMTYLASGVIESWGRRKLLLWGLFGQWVCMLPTGILLLLSDSFKIDYFSEVTIRYLSVFSTIAFVVFFSFALGPVVWIYLSEIYPLEIRGNALAYCGMINWLASLLFVFFSRFLSATISFNTFAGVCVMGWIFTYLFVLETQGTTIDDSPISPRSLRASSRLFVDTDSAVSIEELRSRLHKCTSMPNMKEQGGGQLDRYELTLHCSPASPQIHTHSPAQSPISEFRLSSMRRGIAKQMENRSFPSLNPNGA